ncbi:MAG: cytochrome c oxidase subunit I, partial [Leptolyngbyaceae cyanobacterium RM2_2_4]|nr:cytochrome c oxidase subunit I [Leptolyngbyaceae cyanobacterium RM2_2_4]
MTQAEWQSTTTPTTEGAIPGQRKWQDYFTFNTDHKVIGIQYLVTSFIFYMIGGALATAIRTELATPESDLVSPELYNNLLTVHGTVMIFLWIIPAGSGLANYLIPLMVGARDMAFPKMNALAFWMVPPAGLALIGSFFLEAPQAGWTSYPPLSLMTGKVGEGIWII